MSSETIESNQLAPGVLSAGSHPLGKQELSDDEIKAGFGNLLDSALLCYIEDPQYVLDMCEWGALVEYRRRVFEVRSEVAKTHVGSAVKQETERVCTARGIYPPAKRSRTKRGI